MDSHSYAFLKFIFIQVFTKGVDQEQVMLMAARASRTENQDAIDTAIVGMLADPKEVTGVTQIYPNIVIYISQLIFDPVFLAPLSNLEGTSWHSRSSFSPI